MTTSTSIHSYSPGGSQTPRPSTRASRQRFKPQLSCTFCRTRKLKCDRRSPCQNCTKRNLSASCTYIHAILQQKTSSVHKPSSASAVSQKDVYGRVKHLEDLVLALVNQGSWKDAPSQVESTVNGKMVGSQAGVLKRSERSAKKPDLRETSESFGRISIDDEQPHYVGAAHWAAILEGIADLKNNLDDGQEAQQTHEKSPSTNQGPELLVGSVPRATKVEILAAIPPKPVTDLLVERFLETPEFSTCIHVPTFRKEYEEFWLDPTSTPIPWLGLIFSILCLSLNVEVFYTGVAASLSSLALRDPQLTITLFRHKTIQCLFLDPYTEPKPYTVETLLLYFYTEHFRTLASQSESHVGSWMALGILVRAAMRLGYHRDARHSPSISVLQGEMQRRIWEAIVHMDCQTSCRVGLPRMLNEASCDTAPPSNLRDEDIWDGMKEMPPERPWSEETKNTYPLVKHLVVRIYGRIVDRFAGVGGIEYEEVLKFDRMLNEAWEKVPQILKVKSAADLRIGTPELIVRRFSLNLCFQRARCVLHRKYVVPSRESSGRYGPSVEACVDAAMQILQCQAFVHEESRPERMLYVHRWKISSLMTHDYLLAAMLLCVYLSQGNANGFDVASAYPISSSWSSHDMLRTLEESYRIWDELSHTSKEALKAAKALKKTLLKINARRSVLEGNQHLSPNTQTSTSGSSSISPPRMPSLSVQTEQTISINLVAEDTANFSNFAIPGLVLSCGQSIPQAPLESMIDMPIGLNWELWDSNFYNNLSESIPDLWNFDAGGDTLPSLNDNEDGMEWGY